VLLREVDELDACVLAERMRSDIETTAIAYANQTIRITVSIGIASAHAEDRDIEDPIQAVMRREGALWTF
jgi:PleD family two-component response regulator